MRALVIALSLAAAGARAQEPKTPEPQDRPPTTVPKGAGAKPHDETPTALKLLIKPIRRGILVRLPVIDTDPNRGVTYGVMPIWVIQDRDSSRIEQIHAPSLTYNKTFGPIPTYRYYYYPTSRSTLNLRGALSTQEEREVMGVFEDSDFLDREMNLSILTQYNVDGARRFFGLGADTPKSNEVNFVEDTLQYRVSLGAPIIPGQPVKLHAHNHLQGFKAKEGRTPNLADFDALFPEVRPVHRQQTNEFGLRADFDTRDHPVTTTQGAYLNAGWAASVRGAASMHHYSRYEIDGRYFVPWPGRPWVTAAQVRYQQLLGDAPFWLQPSLGGKYSLRAYGAGRYRARGVLVANLEQRFTMFTKKLAGVTTSFEAAPFTGLGSAFNDPGVLQRRTMRPVGGLAIRAVAKPQVVGSLDFGLGREGLKAFMDINYAF